MTNEKKQKIHKITAILLVVITIITACVIGVCYSVKENKRNDIAQVELSEQTEPEFEYSENKVYDMPKAMAFTAQTLAAAQANGQTVDVAIKASISPWDAANQQVDFSVAWGTAPTHGNESVTDYITVTQESDGSLNATISCKKAFGSDKIIVTVTTRDGGFTANCTVSFVGVASTMSITNSTLNPIQSDNLAEKSNWPIGLINGWIDLIEKAERAIGANIGIDDERYEVLSKHLLIESLFPRFVLCNSYEDMYDDETLLAMRKQFAADFDSLNSGASATHQEHYTFDVILKEWGLK